MAVVSKDSEDVPYDDSFVISTALEDLLGDSVLDVALPKNCQNLSSTSLLAE